MSREIKFRAWDKVAKGWMGDLLKSDYADEDYYSPYMKDEWWAELGYMQCSFDTFNDRIIYLQYTGLKDKNGVESKEIYEDDILLFPDGIRKGLVVFINGCYFLKMKDGHLMNLYDTIVVSRTIRVIGNIHENPELLK
jgi:hypothetical protein